MSLREVKAQLRRRMRKIRGQIEVEVRTQASRAIAQELTARPCLQRAKIVALYADFRDEVGTSELLVECCRAGKVVVLPRTEDGGTLTLRPVDEATALVRSPGGILEPPENLRPIAPNRVDLFVVPGLAFDRNGGRLGYGRGHYDRLLTAAHDESVFVGVAFHCQLVDGIPLEPHDVRLHHVLTEQEWITTTDS